MLHSVFAMGTKRGSCGIDWASGLPDAWIAMLALRVPEVVLVCSGMHDAVSARDLVARKLAQPGQDGRTLMTGIVTHWHSISRATRAGSVLRRRSSREVLVAAAADSRVRRTHLVEAYAHGDATFRTALREVIPDILSLDVVQDVDRPLGTDYDQLMDNLKTDNRCFFTRCIKEKRLFRASLLMAATIGNADIVDMFVRAGAWNLLEAFEAAVPDTAVYEILLQADPSIASTAQASFAVKQAVRSDLLQVADTLVSRGCALDVATAESAIRACMRTDGCYIGPIFRAAVTVAPRSECLPNFLVLRDVIRLGYADACGVMFELLKDLPHVDDMFRAHLAWLRLTQEGPLDADHPMLRFYLDTVKVDSMVVLHQLVRYTSQLPPEACQRMVDAYPSAAQNWTSIAIQAEFHSNAEILEWVLKDHWDAVQTDVLARAIGGGKVRWLTEPMFAVLLAHFLPQLDDEQTALVCTRFTRKQVKQFAQCLEVDRQLVSSITDVCILKGAIKPLLGLMDVKALRLFDVWRAFVDYNVHDNSVLKDLIVYSRSHANRSLLREIAEYALLHCHYTAYQALLLESV